MSDRKEDSFEKFLRSRLNEQSGSKDWNVPSEGLFDSAIEKIDAQKNGKQDSKRRGFFLWLLLPLLLLVALAFMFQKQGSLQEALSIALIENSKLVEEKGNIEALNEEYRNTIENLKAENSFNEISDSGVKDSTEKTLTQVTANALKEEYRGVQQKPTAVGAGMDEYVSQSLINQAEQSQVESNDIFGTSISEEIPEADWSKSIATEYTIAYDQLFALQLRPLKSFTPSDREKLSAPRLADIDKNFSVDNGVSLSLAFAFQRAAMNMEDIQAMGYTLTEYDKFYSGYNAAFQLAKPITNNISILTGLKWSHVVNQSMYQSDLIYDETNEFVSMDGSLMYRNTMDVLSPMGLIQMDDVVPMDDKAGMSSNDLMKNKTNINQRFEILTWTVGAGYRLLKMGDLSLSLGVSGDLNYIVSTSNSLQTNLYNQHLVMTSYDTEAKLNEKNTLFLSLTGSAGLSYELTDRWSMNLLASYGKSLSSLKSKSQQDASSSYLKNQAISLGVGYQF